MAPTSSAAHCWRSARCPRRPPSPTVSHASPRLLPNGSRPSFLADRGLPGLRRHVGVARGPAPLAAGHVGADRAAQGAGHRPGTARCSTCPAPRRPHGSTARWWRRPSRRGCYAAAGSPGADRPRPPGSRVACRRRSTTRARRHAARRHINSRGGGHARHAGASRARRDRPCVPHAGPGKLRHRAAAASVNLVIWKIRSGRRAVCGFAVELVPRLGLLRRVDRSLVRDVRRFSIGRLGHGIGGVGPSGGRRELPGLDSWSEHSAIHPSSASALGRPPRSTVSQRRRRAVPSAQPTA